MRVFPTSKANTAVPTGFSDYVFTANFSKNGNFVDPAINNAKLANISGDGITFYRITGKDAPTYTAGVDGSFNYIQFKLYFTAYNGDSSDTGVKYVYLTGNSTITEVDEEGATATIPFVRVAFLNATGDKIIGIWAPHATVVSNTPNKGDILYIKPTDTYPSANGVVGYTKASGGGSNLYNVLRVINGDLDGGKIQLYLILKN